jgi:CBS domain containing-hemolysin-like protein
MPSSSEPDPSLFTHLNGLIKKLFKVKKRSGELQEQSNLRETLEELIDEHMEDGGQPIPLEEREFLGNLVSFTELTAADVMIPRIDIIAVPLDVSEDELLATFTRSRLQRLPVYRNTLDEVLGVIHVQDILSWSVSGKQLNLKSIMKEVMFISPAMRALDLMYKMREKSSRLAIVVDEYGGVDGLVTLTTIVEEIVGEIHNDQDNQDKDFDKKDDGSIIADGRHALDEIEESMGITLMVDDLEDDVETIGGLVTSLAGHVPIRGELITHPKVPVHFEVVDADPRRVKRVKIWISGT